MKLLEKKVLIGGDLNFVRRYVANLNLNHQAIVNYEILTPGLLTQKLIDEYNLINNKALRLISTKEAAFILDSLISKNDYGLNDLNLSPNSIMKLLDLINDCRLNEVYSFKGMYKADYDKLVKDYTLKLDELELLDYPYALIKVFNKKIDLCAYLLNDLQLCSLEKKAIKNCFKEVINVSPKRGSKNIVAVYDTYGVYNELLNVIDIIDKNKLALSDCEVIYTNDIYENLARGLFDSLGIKYRLTNVHAKSTNLVSFILDILEYVKADFKYELLEKALKNEALDEVYLEEFYKTLSFPKVIVGYGKKRTILLLEDIKYSEAKANIYEFLKELINAFPSKDTIDFDKFITFIKKYCKATNEKLVLIDKIDNLKYILAYTNDKIKVLEEELGSLRYSEADSGEALLVSSINKSFSLRQNLFILGLSQTYLNSYDSENPFIVNLEEYKSAFSNDISIHTLECLKRKVTDALDYYLDYSNSNIYLSYSSFNKIDMRDSAKSIYLINLAKGINSIHKNLYDIEFSNIRMPHKELVDVDKVSRALDNGSIVSDEKHLDEELIVEKLVLKEKEDVFKLSPSALTCLMSCPLQYYYQYMARLSDVSYQQLEVYNWLEANEKGTFFHKILEEYANMALKEDNYKPYIDEATFNEAFRIAKAEAESRNAERNEYIKYKEIKEIKDTAHDFIIKMIDKDFKNQKYRVLATEFNLSDKYKAIYPKNNRLVFSGFIDRLDGYLENRILHLKFVDYKSGKYKNKSDNPYIQHILYPYAISLYQEKLFNFDYDLIVVDSFVYSYPFSNEENVYDTFEVREGDTYKLVFEYIDNIIIPFLEKRPDLFNIIRKNVDEAVPLLNTKEGKDYCKFCSYKGVCVKRVKDGYID